MKISTILDQIDLHNITLPEFQRGYVWNREQVRRLMTSLYRGHPIGTLMVWDTTSDQTKLRGNSPEQVKNISLLLDGQQRITTLYGIIRGKKPPFFEGNAQIFTGLHFNILEEAFEFYAPMRMHGNPAWIDVTDLFKKDVGDFMGPFYQGQVPEITYNIANNRLSRITNIQNRDLYIEQITGADLTDEIVVEIFNNVNSGGTKLSMGDLTLAKVCVTWPEARQAMNRQLEQWRKAGFDFSLDWLLRMMTALITGQAFFPAMRDVELAALEKGLKQSEYLTNTLLNHISSRLGLDHDAVLRSPFALPVMARYLALRDGKFADDREIDRMLFWYIQTFLWGRFAGSTETYISQDLRIVNQGEAALDALIAQVRQMRPDLRVVPNDFIGSTIGARFYPLLYMLTRVGQSRDLGSGNILNMHLLGKTSRLEVHHIFPKALLYKAGYDKSEVNALANFTFLTRETNAAISDRAPLDYFPEYEQRHPGVLASHWIPTDRALWEVKRYRDFLAARRELLASATNAFLEALLNGPAPVAIEGDAVMDQPHEVAPVGMGDAEESPELSAFQTWMAEQQLPPGDAYVEFIDPETSNVLGTFDLVWPDGIQEGLSTPVALCLDGERDFTEAARDAGYRVFTDLATMRRYVERHILGLVPARAGNGGV